MVECSLLDIYLDISIHRSRDSIDTSSLERAEYSGTEWTPSNTVASRYNAHGARSQARNGLAGQGAEPPASSTSHITPLYVSCAPGYNPKKGKCSHDVVDDLSSQQGICLPVTRTFPELRSCRSLLYHETASCCLFPSCPLSRPHSSSLWYSLDNIVALFVFRIYHRITRPKHSHSS